MGAGDRTTTTTASTGPWKGSEPYIKDALKETQKLYNSGQGFDPYPSSTVIPFSNQTQQAMAGVEGLANQGNPLAAVGYGNALGTILNGGMTPEGRSALQSNYDTARGKNQISDNGKFDDLYAKAGEYLSPYASGEYMDGGSPAWKKMVDFQSGQMADDINRGFSNSGRYGSGAQVNMLGENIGRFRNDALASEIQREQALQMQAANELYNQRMGATAGGIGLQGQNLANMTGAGMNFNNAANAGLGMAQNATAQAPGLYQDMFSPYGQLAGVGAQYEDLATRTMQDNVNRFNAEQQSPWQALMAANALYQGAGQLGGTASQTVPAPNLFSQLIGAGAGAAGIAGNLGWNPFNKAA